LSTDEKVGVELLELLAPPEALGEDDEEDVLGEAALGEDEELLGEDEELLLGEDELLEAPPEALPEDLLLSVALGLEELLLSLLPVLCAAATPASAKSAAAVAVTTTFNAMEFLLGELREELQPEVMQSPCPRKGPARDFRHTRVMQSSRSSRGPLVRICAAR
jgi:hypothetical protein